MLTVPLLATVPGPVFPFAGGGDALSAGLVAAGCAFVVLGIVLLVATVI